MTKYYKANTNLSLNIVIPSTKRNLHIAFLPLSNGSSEYSTDNEDIQKGLESHYKYGELFRLVKTEKPAAPKAAKKPAPAPAVEEQEQEVPVEEEVNDTAEVEEVPAEEVAEESENAAPALTKVEVSDMQTAKDYLAENFGLARTQLRSKKAIHEAAAANGIEFVGLE